MLKKKIAITLTLILIALFLPGALRKEEFPLDTVDSVVEVLVHKEGDFSGAGSGFVIGHTDTKTMIATCEHVASSDTVDIRVRIEGKGIVKAEIVCASEQDDVAVIAIEATPELKPLPISKAGPGAVVYTIGFPASSEGYRVVYKDDDTGKIASVGRFIYYTGGWLNDSAFGMLTTAGGNPGMSGGPLLNWKGEVVGIVSFGNAPPLTASGAVTTAGLLKICDEAEVPYTEHFSTRWCRDVIAFILVIALILIITPSDGEEKEKKAARKAWATTKY